MHTGSLEVCNEEREGEEEREREREKKPGMQRTTTCYILPPRLPISKINSSASHMLLQRTNSLGHRAAVHHNKVYLVPTSHTSVDINWPLS